MWAKVSRRRIQQIQQIKLFFFNKVPLGWRAERNKASEKERAPFSFHCWGQMRDAPLPFDADMRRFTKVLCAGFGVMRWIYCQVLQITLWLGCARKEKENQNVRFVARKVSQKRGGQKEEKVQVMAESLLPFLLLLVALLLPPLGEIDSGSPLLLFCKALKPLPVSTAFLIWCLAWSEFIGFLKQEAFF